MYLRYKKCLCTNIQKQYNMLKKVAYFLRKIETSVNNSRVIKIKNPKFSRYCFHLNPNILWNFQICISVHLMITKFYHFLICIRAPLMMIKFYRHYLICKYNFTCSLFWATYYATNDKKIIWILWEISTFRPF